jgi:hypothetical protein
MAPKLAQALAGALIGIYVPTHVALQIETIPPSVNTIFPPSVLEVQLSVLAGVSGQVRRMRCPSTDCRL